VVYPRSAALRAVLDRDSFDNLARAGDYAGEVVGAAGGAGELVSAEPGMCLFLSRFRSLYIHIPLYT